MSTSALEAMRRATRAVANRDLTKLPNGGWNPDIIDPDAEFDLGELQLPDEGRWQGRTDFIGGWQRWLEQWDEYRISVDNFEQHGDRVVADVHAEAQGRGSGVPMSVANTQVWTWRDGRVLRIELFPDRASALAALSPAAPGGAHGAGTPPAP